MAIRSEIVPRTYQSSIATTASKTNTLVILPTGLGKTLIAILVSESRLKEVNPKGRILVLAPTRPLVLQHKETFEKSLLLDESRFVLLTGETDIDDRTDVWENQEKQFVFATPETVLNDLEVGGASLKDFVLVVFDEAHRAVGGYAYTELARLYSNQSLHPLILGLTASPGGSVERVDEVVRNLFVKKVEARNEKDIDVQDFVEETKMDWVKVNLPSEFNTPRNLLRTLYDEKIAKLKNGGFIKPTYFRGQPRITKKNLLESRGMIFSRLKQADYNTNAKTAAYGALISQSQAVIILHAIELLETQGVYTLQKYLTRQKENPEQGKSAKALFKDERWSRIVNETTKLASSTVLEDHPKVPKLRSIISEQLAKKQNSKIIVFTQYRDTIDLIISKLQDNYKQVRCQRFVGQSKKSEQDKGMSQKVQKQVLEKFRTSSEFNVLVSSSIGEEGLHVPDVDLVVFYEAVPSEIRSIQRRGRTGRTMPGRVVVLLAENTVDEAYYYSALYKENKMKKIVENGIVVGADENERSENASLLDFI
ncbi:MAG TPA: helicase-related protein [Nitrososphaerales archaeon]|nr:helicase-related protein [Nitrososphaerales archaeon]